MFTDNERNELVARLMMVLEQQKAGKAAVRQELAGLLADEAREFLKGRYNTTTSDEKLPDGIVQTRDTIDKDDFTR
jgi:hypothetical protein